MSPSLCKNNAAEARPGGQTIAGCRHPPTVGKNSKGSRNRQPSAWKPGEIAFLKSYFNSMLAYDTLPVAVRHRATCHPVIVVAACNDCQLFVVTTVSAYNWEAHGAAPWRQQAHHKKKGIDFWSFVGSEPYVDDRGQPVHPFLELKGDELMPKPHASWVYARNQFLVSAGCLGQFDKSPTRLCLKESSLKILREYLLLHRGKNFFDANARVNCACGPRNQALMPPPPSTRSLPILTVPPRRTEQAAAQDNTTKPKVAPRSSQQQPAAQDNTTKPKVAPRRSEQAVAAQDNTTEPKVAPRRSQQAAAAQDNNTKPKVAQPVQQSKPRLWSDVAALEKPGPVAKPTAVSRQTAPKPNRIR